MSAKKNSGKDDAPPDEVPTPEDSNDEDYVIESEHEEGESEEEGGETESGGEDEGEEREEGAAGGHDSTLKEEDVAHEVSLGEPRAKKRKLDEAMEVCHFFRFLEFNV